MLPDLLRQLKLDNSYGPHSGMPYNQSSVTPGTVDLSPYPSQVHQKDDPEADRLSKVMDNRAGVEYLLDCLYDVLAQPQYETYGPFSFGGTNTANAGQIGNVTGTGSIFTIVNPFDTDCEWSCLCAAFGGQGQATLSNDPYIQAPLEGGFFDGGSYIRALTFMAAASNNQTFAAGIWFPLPASDSLYWSVNMNAPGTKSAIATVAFRRRIDRHGKPKLTVR